MEKRSNFDPEDLSKIFEFLEVVEPLRIEQWELSIKGIVLTIAGFYSLMRPNTSFLTF